MDLFYPRAPSLVTRHAWDTVDLFYPRAPILVTRHDWDTVDLFYPRPLVSSHDMTGIQWTYSIPRPVVVSYDMPRIQRPYSIPRATKGSKRKQAFLITLSCDICRRRAHKPYLTLQPLLIGICHGLWRIRIRPTFVAKFMIGFPAHHYKMCIRNSHVVSVIFMNMFCGSSMRMSSSSLRQVIKEPDLHVYMVITSQHEGKTSPQCTPRTHYM